MKKINADEIKLLSKYIYDVSGIIVDASKAYLLETRLNSLLDEMGLASYRDLYYKAVADSGKLTEGKIIDAISTNETLFFRDTGPFEVLRHKILPDLIDARSNRSTGQLPISIRIWSAACSTGQEVYSIAIILKELLMNMSKYSIKLLGTDISDAAVKKSSYGEYGRFEIERGLPSDKLNNYFHRSGENWKIRDELRAMAQFRKINLHNSLRFLGQFDIIFCRNVAIYFSPEDRKKLFDKLAGMLAPDGYLIIGSTESLTGVSDKYVPQRHLRSIYYQLQ